ncbi:hypothetical protein B277_05568 [Janibacter hoylei PVAS-1]|uniref:Uncharacterized protein n=1 Tax=Janibacter hoylei PVAS-1 TaxID=1210046 RepID=K1E845_9MICO|nr:hypothetical protein B277_05568 [Janibacter hoylei PVAS-1]
MRMEPKSVESRPGRVEVIVDCAVSIAPLQSLDQPGRAHSVSTSAKPASLPPTEMLTRSVEDDRAPAESPRRRLSSR